MLGEIVWTFVQGTGMHTIVHWQRYNNNSDVVPGLVALEKMRADGSLMKESVFLE